MVCDPETARASSIKVPKVVASQLLSSSTLNLSLRIIGDKIVRVTSLSSVSCIELSSHPYFTSFQVEMYLIYWKAFSKRRTTVLEGAEKLIRKALVLRHLLIETKVKLST
uniref:Uncharacterized protein n=1 Tax=Steinernema glaseri TaxID=37863 RepID=A0A1I8ADX1_9BILA